MKKGGRRDGLRRGGELGSGLHLPDARKTSLFDENPGNEGTNGPDPLVWVTEREYRLFA